MKRVILLLFAVVIAFSSCENLEDNSPALQGEIDSIFFKAVDVRGEKNEDGSYTLQGINQDQKLTLNLNRAQLGTYRLGGGQPSYATFINSAGDEYSTNPYGEGEIVLSDRCISCGWLTGNFWFTAKRSEFDSLPVAVQKGFFFEVSFLGGNVEEGPPSLGSMVADINDIPFDANSVTLVESGGTITVTGFDSAHTITIQIPSNAVSGNYILPLQGYSASYTFDGVTTEAEAGGLVSVNFNDTVERKVRIFFNFTADGNSITNGNTAGPY
jgi:hypothetical protein